jgi:phenylpyruvate tautomerase PptA (4-oxalocrotonate tautomerase family)
MPILDVEIVVRPNESLPRELAAELANRAGEIFGAPPGTTWVKVRSIARKNYAENGAGPPEGVFPVFVSVLKVKLPPPDTIQIEVVRLTEAIAQVCARPKENVHIVYLPEGAGRVAFGGKVVR